MYVYPEVQVLACLFLFTFPLWAECKLSWPETSCWRWAQLTLPSVYRRKVKQQKNRIGIDKIRLWQSRAEQAYMYVSYCETGPMTNVLDLLQWASLPWGWYIGGPTVGVGRGGGGVRARPSVLKYSPVSGSTAPGWRPQRQAWHGRPWQPPATNTCSPHHKPLLHRHTAVAHSAQHFLALNHKFYHVTCFAQGRTPPALQLVGWPQPTRMSYCTSRSAAYHGSLHKILDTGNIVLVLRSICSSFVELLFCRHFYT